MNIETKTFYFLKWNKNKFFYQNKSKTIMLTFYAHYMSKIKAETNIQELKVSGATNIEVNK